MHFRWFQLIKSLCAEHGKPLCTLNTLLSWSLWQARFQWRDLPQDLLEGLHLLLVQPPAKKSNCRNKSGTFKKSQRIKYNLSVNVSKNMTNYAKPAITDTLTPRSHWQKRWKKASRWRWRSFNHMMNHVQVGKPSNTCTQVLCCSPLVLAGNLASTWPCFLVKSSFELWALVQLLCLFVWTRHNKTHATASSGCVWPVPQVYASAAHRGCGSKWHRGHQIECNCWNLSLQVLSP